ncbi:MAG: aspartyl protease family protein [Blastocatellia bacterium]
MIWQINFTERYHYQTTQSGIGIPVTISREDRVATFMAKVDTGARYCLFKREHGELLGIDIEKGEPITLDTLGGPLDAFLHEVTLQTFDLTFQSFVCFAKYRGLRRNLLGSVGWLRNIVLGVIDYDEMVFLGPYVSHL